MAKAYSQYKVNELKEILRERNLSLNGTKSELIARLEEDDASKAEEAVPEPEAEESVPQIEPEQPVPEVEQSVPEPVGEAEVAGEAAPAEETVKEEPVGENEAPINTLSSQISDEDVMRTVKEDLTKQIARAKRFGGDPTPLEQRLNRINKFGIAAIRDAAIKAEQPVERRRFRKPKPLRRKKQVN